MRPWMATGTVAVVFSLGTLDAQATTPIPSSANFAVNATVSSGCLVVGNPSQTTGVGFGKLDFGTQPAILGTTVNASLSMNAGSMAQIQCTTGVSVTMTLDGGQNALGNQRRMKLAPNNYLPYTLYSTGGSAVPLLPGVGFSITASSSPMTLPVYGTATLPGGGVPAGQYTDTVQVVFSW